MDNERQKAGKLFELDRHQKCKELLFSIYNSKFIIYNYS